ncbi:MAG: DUF4915 domain-containing protein [Actinobacteria bacterium]|nr:DUF4915 domain-containing protein [Actinomycetota bacterium]
MSTWYTLSAGDRVDNALVISAFGDETGGLYEWDGHAIARIDGMGTTGLSAAEGRVFRVLWSYRKYSAGAETYEYDDVGVKRYFRTDGIPEPGDIANDGDLVAYVSSELDGVAWVDHNGQLVKQWSASNLADAWHVNSLDLQPEGLYVSAFGRFEESQAWKDSEKAEGFLMSVADGSVAVSGLARPGTFGKADGYWWVCEQGKRRLARFDGEGTFVDAYDGVGVPQGLEVSDDFVFFSEAPDQDTPFDNSVLVILDRASLAEIDRIELPCRGVHTIKLMPQGFMHGVRTGFMTNPFRISEVATTAQILSVHDRTSQQWATGDPVPAEECNVLISASIPNEMPASRELAFDATVLNRANVVLATQHPHPVNLCYRWFDVETGEYAYPHDEYRTALNGLLAPFQEQRLRMIVKTPTDPGEYELRVTLVQENVQWFDDINPMNMCTKVVRIADS